MDENYKVIVDNQAKQSLEELQKCFEDILAPLENLRQIQGLLNTLQSSVVANGDNLRKITKTISDAEKSLSKEISELKEETLSEIKHIQNEIDGFKKAVQNISWE